MVLKLFVLLGITAIYHQMTNSFSYADKGALTASLLWGGSRFFLALLGGGSAAIFIQAAISTALGFAFFYLLWWLDGTVLWWLVLPLGLAMLYLF